MIESCGRLFANIGMLSDLVIKEREEEEVPTYMHSGHEIKRSPTRSRNPRDKENK